MAIGKLSAIYETIWMLLAFLILGINYSALGPTLLDLQLFLKQDLETLSTIPLSSGIGETTGMFLTLWLSKYGNKRLQLSISLLLSSIVIAIIPITNSYIYVAVMFFLVGFISAIPSCFLMDVCSELWKDKGTTFQFILVGSSLGAILTPLIVEPFLCRGGQEVLPGINSTEDSLSGEELITMNEQCSFENLAIIHNWCLNFDNRSGVDSYTETSDAVTNIDTSMCPCTSLSALQTLNYISNTTGYLDNNVQAKLAKWESVCGHTSTTDIPSHTLDLVEGNTFLTQCCTLLNALYDCDNSYGADTNTTNQCTEKDTNVRSAYIVLGCILLPTSFAFFYYWLKRDSRWATAPITESQRQDHVDIDLTHQGRLEKYTFYILIFLSFLPLTSLTIVFATYLTAFGVQGRLQLSKSTMVFMTSVFWLSTLIGRILSTAITPFIGDTKVIIFNFAGLFVSAILLVLLAPYYIPVLWLSTVLLGLFACPYEGAGLAWAAKYVGMSSNLIFLSWVSVSIGNLAFPFVAGIMFENIGPFAFLYLLAGMIVFIVLMFGIMLITARYLKK